MSRLIGHLVNLLAAKESTSSEYQLGAATTIQALASLSGGTGACRTEIATAHILVEWRAVHAPRRDVRRLDDYVQSDGAQRREVAKWALTVSSTTTAVLQGAE